ncbi:hypothetical protein Tco_0733004 [Tanacetum coccineum]
MGRHLHHHLLLHNHQGHQGLLASPPLSSSTHQGGQSTSTAAPSSSKTAASAEYSAWTTTDTRIKPSITTIPDDLYMDDETTTDEQAYSSGEEVGRDHIPYKSTVQLDASWWKPLTEDRPATPEPAWTIPSSDLPVPTNNWASALKTTYVPPPENSLLAQTEELQVDNALRCMESLTGVSKTTIWESLEDSLLKETVEPSELTCVS